MKKIIQVIGVGFLTQYSFADTDSIPVVANINDNYIHSQSYLQNPFGRLPSQGGTQYVTESQMASQNFAERLFADGTWNVYGFSGIQQNNGKPMDFALSSTLFGQTGSIGGFSLGGAFIVTNPFLVNTPGYGSAGPYIAYPFLSSAQRTGILQGYLEYQYSHIVQADVGWITINNSPFLAGSYYADQTSGVQYQGASVNVNPGSGWLLTGIGFNGAQYPGLEGFTGLTLYDPGSISGAATGFSNQGSQGTIALGASYATPGNMYNFRAWGYQFDNYASLLYADNSIKLPVNKDTYFTVAAQGGKEWGLNNNAITSAGQGTIDSNFVGAQLGFNYHWFNLTAGYENVWGPSTAFGSGALVSPYTYNENVDPLFGNSWMTGLVQKASSGQMFIVSPTINLMDSNLSIAPAYSQIFNTPSSLPDEELDMVVSYTVPQVRGLKFFAVYAYMFQPSTGTNQQTGQTLQGGDAWTTLGMISYLY